MCFGTPCIMTFKKCHMGAREYSRGYVKQVRMQP